MLPLLTGAISAAAPAVIDLFTGASKKQKRAYDDQQNQLQALLNQINGEMGTGANDSSSYAAAMALADKSCGKHSAANLQDAAASGMSDEAQLGQLATMNDGFNDYALGALDNARQDRNRLQSQYSQVAAQKAGLGVERANQGVANQNALLGGAMQLLPFMMSNGGGADTFSSDATRDIATGATPAPTLNAVNPSDTALPAMKPAILGGGADPAQITARMNRAAIPSTGGMAGIRNAMNAVQPKPAALFPNSNRSTSQPLFQTSQMAAPLAFKNQKKGFF